jgi:tripartite-type tricarboxylate transporter receptor subunit TctC
MEYLKLVTGMYITHIPYRGTGPQLHRPAGRAHPGSRRPDCPRSPRTSRAGKLRAIAVGTQRRIEALLPDVPTVAEMGFKDFETSQWYGVLVAGGHAARTRQADPGRVQQGAEVFSAVTERFANDSAVGGGGPSKPSLPISSRASRPSGKTSSSEPRIKAD